MVDVSDLQGLAREEGFKFSVQALNMLVKLVEPSVSAKELLTLAKKRRFIISGGDVLKYVLDRPLSTSLINADDKIIKGE